jgi:hypothetical protein
MKNFRVTVAAGILAAAMNLISPAHSSQDPPKPTQGAANMAGSHDFDFQVGEWRDFRFNALTFQHLNVADPKWPCRITPTGHCKDGLRSRTWLERSLQP